MGRPHLPIWKEFVTTVPAGSEKRCPDVECLHCRTSVNNARPINLMRHVLRCPEIPEEVVNRLTSGMRQQRQYPAPQYTVSGMEAGMLSTTRQAELSGEGEQGTETNAAPVTSTITPTERRPVLGKRPRAPAVAAASTATATTVNAAGNERLEEVLTSIRDVLEQTLECKQQELQLRREELEFQREALATKMEDRRQAREEERRDRREQREADRQEKLELARIENEKNLAFLKAVMESSQQARRSG